MGQHHPVMFVLVHHTLGQSWKICAASGNLAHERWGHHYFTKNQPELFQRSVNIFLIKPTYNCCLHFGFRLWSSSVMRTTHVGRLATDWLSSGMAAYRDMERVRRRAGIGSVGSSVSDVGLCCVCDGLQVSKWHHSLGAQSFPHPWHWVMFVFSSSWWCFSGISYSDLEVLSRVELLFRNEAEWNFRTCFRR